MMTDFTFDVFLLCEIIKSAGAGIFISLAVLLIFCLIIAAIKPDEEIIEKHTIGIICTGAFIVLITISLMMFGSLSGSIVKANKQRIIAYYTSPQIVKEELEPIIEGYLEAIKKQIESPNLSININTLQKSEP